VTRRLPVAHLAAHRALRAYLDELAPRAVLCTGLAKGLVFRMEQRARQPLALLGEAGAAEARGRWPWAEMRAALEAAAVPCIDSEDAGQYVCESTYWSLLNQPSVEFAAFLHVPNESAEFPIQRIADAVSEVVLARYGALCAAL
jgi:pyrrolidone-carboxylate peptidase